MALISLQNAQLAWGDAPLLDNASLSIEPGKRIGIIGRNGTGKSSLLAVLADKLALDDGLVQRQNGLRTHYVEQEPTLLAHVTIKEALIQRGQLQTLNDEREQWRVQARIDEYLQYFHLNGEQSTQYLSGGELKRAALVLAFALEPDLLLLDEPTNHLDIEAISILESLIKTEFKNQKSLCVITHDRQFLDNVVTEIVELDRGVLREYPGTFTQYESRKAAEIEAEIKENRRFDKFWAQEEVWIRKGIEARRTRNEGRVRRLEQLRRERSARRERLGQVKLQIDAGDKSGKIVAEISELNKVIHNKPIVKDLNLTILRGDRLGLVGPNGAGKSTLIKLLLGQMQPDSGQIKLGTNLQIAYFDQLRDQLDIHKTVRDTITLGSDWVEINGQKKHVLAYLSDFLFPPRRANVPVSSLSGGERNRLLLARLFAMPANFLVLDEPTNDLDIDSLDLLEQTLSTYPGTIILVSHDRRFLDNVVTDLLVYQQEGQWLEFVGGYSDWALYEKNQLSASTEEKTANASPSAVSYKETKKKNATKQKLSYKENKELESLPQELEALEQELLALSEQMSSADYYTQAIQKQQEDSQRLKDLEALIEEKFARWEFLDQLQQSFKS